VTSAPALELRGIAKLYGPTAALKAISIRLECGETMALLGPNGSGKTTLLKIVAGAITPTLGSGSIYGRDLLEDRPALRSVVGLLATESYLYEDLTAEENVRFMLTMAGRRPAGEVLLRTLEEVGLGEHGGERVRTFSAGMKRRLAIARILLLRPHLLLLDEPYNSLDADGLELMDTLVRGHARTGGAVMLATHDAERALALADRVAVLERGTLAYAGPRQGYRIRNAHYVG
jgi:heme exporter protein A